MARPRLDLQELLEDTLGSTNVYFQPPNNLTLRYPCIIYLVEGEDVQHANDQIYRDHLRYQVTLITREPDDPIFHRIRRLPFCSLTRTFTSDDLNHANFTLFY